MYTTHWGSPLSLGPLRCSFNCTGNSTTPLVSPSGGSFSVGPRELPIRPQSVRSVPVPTGSRPSSGYVLGTFWEDLLPFVPCHVSGGPGRVGPRTDGLIPDLEDTRRPSLRFGPRKGMTVYFFYSKRKKDCRRHSRSGNNSPPPHLTGSCSEPPPDFPRGGDCRHPGVRLVN